ncbi:hypothetical protein [Dyella sp. OK004]|uniref:hypothetical protein n=1 Tax=Dyella sp. OK004 TaxID=1855292 RepID=UPI000B8557EE|nr:hypothetical protein [Dyella sp. OK004]
MKKGIQATELESLDVDGLGLVKKGLRVVHPMFGTGTVVALFAFHRGGHSIGVEFVTAGYKALAPEYAKLQLADVGSAN